MASVSTEDVVNRLKRVEGQIRGLQRMIEEGQECSRIVNQLCAARRALDKVGFIVLTGRLRECAERRGADQEKAVEEAMELFLALA